LLRKHKASHFDRPVLPRMTPVGGALLEHYSGLRTSDRRRNDNGSKRGGLRRKAGRTGQRRAS